MYSPWRTKNQSEEEIKYQSDEPSHAQKESQHTHFRFIAFCCYSFSRVERANERNNNRWESSFLRIWSIYGCMVKETHRCRSIKRGKHSINSIEFTSHFGSMVHIGSFAIGNWSWKLRKVIQLKYRIVRCLFVWHAEKYRVHATYYSVNENVYIIGICLDSVGFWCGAVRSS